MEQKGWRKREHTRQAGLFGVKETSHEPEHVQVAVGKNAALEVGAARRNPSRKFPGSLFA